MMQSNSFLLYGANGYTGELIARYAHEYNLQPILAGRRKEVIEPLAGKLKLPYRIFDINDTAALQAALKEVGAVIHAAGPFQFTAKQMIEACLQTGTHYLDINGDIAANDVEVPAEQVDARKGQVLGADHRRDQEVAEHRRHQIGRAHA